MSTMVVGEKDLLKQRRRSRRSPNPVRAGSGKSSKSLDSGHKLHLDLTKGCFIVKREKSVFSNIFDLGLKYVKSLFGIPTADPVEDEASESLNPLEQLPDLFPHRHRPVSL